MQFFFLLIAFVVAAGILYAAFEKILDHRKAMAKLQLDMVKSRGTEATADVEQLRAEILALRERLDEQAILIDDLKDLTPLLQQRIEN